MAGCSSDDGDDEAAAGTRDPEQRPAGEATVASGTGDESDDGEASPGIGDASSPTEGQNDDPENDDNENDDTENDTEANGLAGGFCGGERASDIRFDPGAESATVAEVEVAAGELDRYRLTIGDDQILTVRVTSSSTVTAAVLAPGAETAGSSAAEQTVFPTTAGTYEICVAAGATGASYDLFVSVIDDRSPDTIIASWCGDSVNDRGDIRFAAGEFSGVAEDAVIVGERDLYRVEARAGQNIEIVVTAVEANASFGLRSAETGEVFVTEVSDFRFPLPVDGIYEICVGPTRGNASYTLSVVIG